MKKVLAACLAIALAPSALADSLETSSEALSLTDKAMQLVAGGDVKAGIELVKPYSVVPAVELDGMVNQAAVVAPIIASRFGKSIGYELIRNDTVGESLVRVVYLHKFEEHAMVWKFVLYKGSDGWQVNSVNFVDSIETAF